jgi:phage tail sheath protein FI
VTTSRAPGIYSVESESRYVPMGLGPSGVAGFVGMAERGPTDLPTRVTSYEEFLTLFGEPPLEGYLGPAIQGFFLNGGRACYVLRIAHQVSRSGEEIAARAHLDLQTDGGAASLRIEASNPGLWANRVRINIERPEPRVSTLLTLDVRPGDTSAVIKSTHGLVRGSIIRFRDKEGEAYRTVTELSGKTISWAEDQPLERPFDSGAPTWIEPLEFHMSVQWGAQRERYRYLSMSPAAGSYFERVLNDRSRLVRVTDARDGLPPQESTPATLHDVTLVGGLDGAYTVTPDDFIGANIGPEERYGIAAFEAIEEVDLLLAPDLCWALSESGGFRSEADVHVVQEAMVSQCERLKTRMAILDFPDPSDIKRASQWRLHFDSAFAAFYFPWVATEHQGEQRLVPPSGHVSGIFARCDVAMGPYRAPANEEIEGIFDVGLDLRESDIARLNQEGVNCLKGFARRGIRVWGARTTSSDPMWRFINVRRVMNTVISSVERGLQWTVFETNTPLLWKTLTRQVTSFLMDLWREGYFQGRTPEEAFFVKCDDETNPEEIRDVGIVVVECGIAPVRPAEFISFKVEAELDEVRSGG